LSQRRTRGQEGREGGTNVHTSSKFGRKNSPQKPTPELKTQKGKGKEPGGGGGKGPLTKRKRPQLFGDTAITS